jgi:threonine/homoserine/homoserine lactone efflux protein
MLFNHWIAFTLAAAVLLAIPGPTVLLVIGYALGQGRRSAFATVAGVALGDFTAMTASMLGIGLLLAASAELFLALRWLGAAYLIYLGIKLWRTPAGTTLAAKEGATPPRRMFWHAYAVTALNPKSIVFFVAFLPQFLDASTPFPLQMAIFEATFVALAALNATAYATVASAVRDRIRKPSVQRAVNRLGGSLLIGAGLLAAAWRRA